jgi:hypothetical protein
MLGNDGPDAWIYIDQFGERLLYAGEGGAASFAVVPAPAGAALVVVGAIRFVGRRRR